HRSILLQLETLTELETLIAPAQRLADHDLVGARLCGAAGDDVELTAQLVAHRFDSTHLHVRDLAVSTQLFLRDHHDYLARAEWCGALLFHTGGRLDDAYSRVFDTARQLCIAALTNHHGAIVRPGADQRLLDAIRQHQARCQHEDDQRYAQCRRNRGGL